MEDTDFRLHGERFQERIFYAFNIISSNNVLNVPMFSLPPPLGMTVLSAITLNNFSMYTAEYYH